MLAHTIQQWAAVAAATTMLISPALSAPPRAAGPIDVALHEGGLLAGQVVDAQGTPMAGADVAVRALGREVAGTRTDEKGAYAIAGLRGGVYEIVTANSAGVYRLWAPRTAPPAANQQLMLVTGAEVVRGQHPGPVYTGPDYPSNVQGPGPFAKAMGWIAEHPIITTLGVATAIAVPLAINDNDPAS